MEREPVRLALPIGYLSIPHRHILPYGTNIPITMNFSYHYNIMLVMVVGILAPSLLSSLVGSIPPASITPIGGLP